MFYFKQGYLRQECNDYALGWVLNMFLFHERCSNIFVCWNKLEDQTPHWILRSMIDELLGQHWTLILKDLQTAHH